MTACCIPFRFPKQQRDFFTPSTIHQRQDNQLHNPGAARKFSLFFLCHRTTCYGSCAQVHCRCRYPPQHKPGHQVLGQRRQVRRETSTLEAPRPYLGRCHLLQYSVQHSGKHLGSPVLWHPISQSSPITIPTYHSVSSYKETQGWGTTKARGQSLRFSSLP